MLPRKAGSVNAPAALVSLHGGGYRTLEAGHGRGWSGEMKLPNAERAIVAPEKIIAYLLNPANRQNRGKARFFLAFGFTVSSWQILAAALRTQAVHYDVDGMREDAFGVRYTIIGPLETPDGRSPIVRSVWQIDAGATAPRFISAYPV
jgi:hypothetical protein